MIDLDLLAPNYLVDWVGLYIVIFVDLQIDRFLKLTVVWTESVSTNEHIYSIELHINVIRWIF